MTLTRLKTKFLFIFAITLIFFVFQTISAFESPFFKLPSAIFPTKYHLNISTLIHQNILAYNGSVSIDITIREGIDEIVLNSNNLRQFKITLINIDSELILESHQIEYELDEVKEQLRINWPLFPLKLQIGQQYRLKIDFVGDIQENEGIGFYKSTYLDENNNNVSISTTHFEPTGARLAFPCFDEPAFKAKFVIGITHGSNYSAISNMPSDGDPIRSSTPNGEMVTTKFLETPKMSTYLIAFAITNYNKTTILVNSLEHRYFYPPNSKDNGSRVLENAIKTVNALEKLLGIKYTLPKLDHIQIGKMYGIAMENWGLMTFHRHATLSNQKDYDKLDLLEMINIQSHEIAHQWFGNLVTPTSWNYLWLKEGFSSYFSFMAANLVHLEEKILEYFLINEVQPVTAMQLTHPLTNIIAEGDDIKNNMDIVTYNFGSNFVRMFHHAIGNSTFMKGIFKYLITFQYSIVDEDDFFRAIQAAVDEDNCDLFQNNQSVANVMRTWTQNIGFPIVTIIRNYETGTIIIRQKPKSEEDKEQKWWIPMNFATASNPDFERTIADYIMPPKAEVILDLKVLNISLSNSDWLIVNKKQTGIFLVVYDDLNLKLITEALTENRNKIHLFNRAQIFRDLSITFDEDLDAIEPLLGILESLKLEEESLPWLNAINLIMKVLSKLKGSSIWDTFESFIYDIIVGIYSKKYEDPLAKLTVTDLKLKPKMMILKFIVDTKSCQNYTTELTKEYFLNGIVEKNNKPCKLNLCKAIQNATIQEFQAYVSRMNQMKNTGAVSVEWYELQTVLKCLESKELFKYLFDYLQINSKQDDKNYDTLRFYDLLVLNKSFRVWVLKYHIDEVKNNGLSDTEILEMDLDEEIMMRTNFLRKYENSILRWLENYEKNTKLREME